MKNISFDKLVDKTDSQTSQIHEDGISDRPGMELILPKNDEDFPSLGTVINPHRLFLLYNVIENRDALRVEKRDGQALLRYTQNESVEKPQKEDVYNTARIPLTQGQVALVDAEALPLLAPYRWTAIRSGNTWYAKAHVGSRTIYMHRLIVLGNDAETVPLKVDHRNRNGLDNRRHNLRLVTHSRNLMNSVGNASTRKSLFKGVSLCKRPSKPYRATIHVNGKQRHLGYFASERAAAEAYDQAASEEFGSHARVNFPEKSRWGYSSTPESTKRKSLSWFAAFCLCCHLTSRG